MRSERREIHVKNETLDTNQVHSGLNNSGISGCRAISQYEIRSSESPNLGHREEH